MRCLVSLLVSSLLLVSFPSPSRSHNAQDPKSGPLIESGKFRIYDTKQVTGEENYEIRQTGAGPGSELRVTAEINFPFMGEEQKPKLTSSLRARNDLTPQSFEIKGIRPLEIAIDTAIRIEGRTASVTQAGTAATTVTVPQNFFTFSSYVPVTMEMMLVRYWLKHGRRNPIPLLPRGEAYVEYRGRDTVTVGGRRTVLNRYHLSGSKWVGGGWGRQTLWLDSKERLVAAVNLGTDVEVTLTAVRDGYETALSFFLKRAIDDCVDRFTQLADRLSPKTGRPLVLLGGTVIDGTAKPPLGNSAVVIQGERIIAVGPRDQIKIPKGATTVDATGKFLVPGLWDMHAHFYQAELGPAYLATGITSATDVGNEIEFSTALRDAAKQGRGLGPRMSLAGYIDGKNDFHSFDVQVATPAEAIAAVQRYKNAGFVQIKIRDHVKPDILKVITTEAHRLGMTVTGHVPKGLNALQAVEAGMDQIAHLNFAATGFLPDQPSNQPPIVFDADSANSQKALRVFKEHRTVIDPTIAILELMIHPMNMPIASFEPGISVVAPELLEQIEKKGAPAEEAEGIRLVMIALKKMIGALHRAGVPIVAGTDVGAPGHTLHRELELYVQAGMTPLEAIQAATITPARVMKMEKEVGTIETGKRADILILAANPLENISNIRKTKFVVAQGRLFDCSELRKIVGFKP